MITVTNWIMSDIVVAEKTRLRKIEDTLSDDFCDEIVKQQYLGRKE